MVWSLCDCVCVSCVFLLFSYVYLVFLLVILFVLLTLYVQVCADAAVEDHCLVLSFVDSRYGSVPYLCCPCCVVYTWQLLGSELWQTCCMPQFLACTVPAVSWTPDSCHLAWMIATVACGLAPSFYSSNLWVDRHSVPWACLPHPCWIDAVACGLSSSFQGCDVWLNRRLCRHIDAHGLAECVCSSVHALPHLHDWLFTILFHGSLRWLRIPLVSCWVTLSTGSFILLIYSHNW